MSNLGVHWHDPCGEFRAPFLADPAVPGTDVTAWLLSVLPIPNAFR